MSVKFPNVNVDLVGQDGNAYSILGRVKKALDRGGATKAEQNEYYAEATSGDYDHLLRTTLAWVNVDTDDDYDSRDDAWPEDEDEDEDYWYEDD